jgi:hypothetical protein
VNWIHLAQNKDQWRSLVNKVMTDQMRDSHLVVWNTNKIKSPRQYIFDSDNNSGYIHGSNE